MTPRLDIFRRFIALLLGLHLMRGFNFLDPFNLTGGGGGGGIGNDTESNQVTNDDHSTNLGNESTYVTTAGGDFVNILTDGDAVANALAGMENTSALALAGMEKTSAAGLASITGVVDSAFKTLGDAFGAMLQTDAVNTANSLAAATNQSIAASGAAAGAAVQTPIAAALADTAAAGAAATKKYLLIAGVIGLAAFIWHRRRKGKK
jgi:hypothetical protein